MDNSTFFAMLAVFFGAVAFKESLRRRKVVARARLNDADAAAEIQSYGWSLYQAQFWYGTRGMAASLLLVITALAAWYYIHIK